MTDLAHIQRSLDAITRPPWIMSGHGVDSVPCVIVSAGLANGESAPLVCSVAQDADAEFIAKAPEYVADLLAEVRRLRQAASRGEPDRSRFGPAPGEP